jgi:hypothetical protein
MYTKKSRQIFLLNVGAKQDQLIRKIRVIVKLMVEYF